mgnify:CR=1 FL=1
MAQSITDDVETNLGSASAMGAMLQQAVPDISVVVTAVLPVAIENTVLSSAEVSLLPASPRPPSSYLTLLARYIHLLIFLKFVVQLPIVCLHGSMWCDGNVGLHSHFVVSPVRKPRPQWCPCTHTVSWQPLANVGAPNPHDVWNTRIDLCHPPVHVLAPAG